MLADLNPVLFWSTALGETNSLWLSAATHILCCPSALTERDRGKVGVGDEGEMEMERERKRTTANSSVRWIDIRRF